MALSAEELSKPISEELPCGEDLEYDPAFQQMETLMQEKAEQEVGDVLVAGSGPDWKGVVKQTKELLGRTRDMRVFVNAAMAGLNTEGLGAFNEAITALNNCMENYWDALHPVLDEDDGFDPTMRMNVLQNLGDYNNVRVGLEKSPLVELRGVGQFSFHHIQLAEGKETPEEDEEVVDAGVIQGAFSEADPEHLNSLAEAITGSIEQLERMHDIWAEKTENFEAPDLEMTVSSLKHILQTVSSYSPTVAEAAGEQEGDDGENATVEVGSGAINSRSDVIRAIDKICEYYSVNEPSSPVPMILRRAQRLVAKSFFEILEDIAPDSVPTAQMLSGQSPE